MGAELRTQQDRHDGVLVGPRVAAPLRYVAVGLVIYEACGILRRCGSGEGRERMGRGCMQMRAVQLFVVQVVT